MASQSVSAADLTWRAGVDVMSFGGTKNGCVAAEAVVFFDPSKAADFPYARQRAGHGFAKAWFLAAQFEAYLNDGLWMKNANHANGMAARLAAGIRKNSRARLALEPAANELFVILPKSLDSKLKSAGAIYGPWSFAALAPGNQPKADEVLVRLVATWQTSAAEVDRFCELLNVA
jgi:threonine aldolase